MTKTITRASVQSIYVAQYVVTHLMSLEVVNYLIDHKPHSQKGWLLKASRSLMLAPASE
jgi:hypothetical protein